MSSEEALDESVKLELKTALQKARKAEAVAKLAAGMNGHIAKPIQVDKLLSTLKTILTENIIL